VILSITGAILPSILIFTLPLSYLIGILIGLSGLSGESQIVALRACGVPLRCMLRPILALACVVGAVTGFLSIYALPEASSVLYGLKDQISLRQATAQIQPRVFNESFPNLVFYLDDLAADRQRWSRVFVSDNSDPKSPRIVLARAGTWVTESKSLRLQLHLEHGTIYEVNPDDPSKDNVSVFASTDIPIDLSGGQLARAEGTDPHRPKKAIELSTAELWRSSRNAASPQKGLEERIEFHKRLSIPVSVLAFSLLGLTLGISTRKGGRTSGFVLSLFLVLLFYVAFVKGMSLATIGLLPPWLGAWGANILLGACGLILLLTAERQNPLREWLSGWRLEAGLGSMKRRVQLTAGWKLLRKTGAQVADAGSRLRVFRVLDLYVSKGFIVFFLWSLLVCTSLFVILTLFDLLDDIIKNRIPALYVINYFVFLIPQMLMFFVPMSILLAILICFGVLEKHSEVTALKAGGLSLYRIAMPVFLIAVLLCLNIYFMQDYILPYANIRQESLRNVIKARPAQTSMRPQRKWIFGESDRIFNYQYFDPGQNRFVELNVFEVDLRDSKILRRVHAERAAITDTGKWFLERGWIRDFSTTQSPFRPITAATFDFPERANYFQKEIFEPKESSKLTYLELKDYIKYLSQSGYNATELRVEMHKKISFPLSCLVMALVGVPFSFSMGKKGAFFGIGLSIAIAMSYWGAFSLFEQMGAYGLLIPALAAWAPNILFAATGLFFLFTVRT